MITKRGTASRIQNLRYGGAAETGRVKEPCFKPLPCLHSYLYLTTETGDVLSRQNPRSGSCKRNLRTVNPLQATYGSARWHSDRHTVPGAYFHTGRRAVDTAWLPASPSSLPGIACQTVSDPYASVRRIREPAMDGRTAKIQETLKTLPDDSRNEPSRSSAGVPAGRRRRATKGPGRPNARNRYPNAIVGPLHAFIPVWFHLWQDCRQSK